MMPELLIKTDLEALRNTGDEVADLIIHEIFASNDQKIQLQAYLASINTNADLSIIPDVYAGSALFDRSAELPVWADIALMRAGAAFFARYAPSIMNMLGLLSLPYCYTAANGAMVLYQSERLMNDTGKRLLETAAFVWDVMAPDAFEKGGKGFASIFKVRLLHSAVRYYTLKSGHWDNIWGKPVNQEDMAGTNLSFSLIVIRGLRKFGYAIAYQEQQAFMHLWNVIGSLMGIQEHLLPLTGKQAHGLEEAIRLRQFRPSAHGVALTASLTDYLCGASKGSPFTGAEVLQLMRYLLGDEIAGMLSIKAGKLPKEKIRLLKAINFINELKPSGNGNLAYLKAYNGFKKNNLANLSGKN